MKWFLEWRIRRLKRKLAKMEAAQGPEAESRARSLGFVLKSTKLKYKIADLQTEHDLWYGNKYEIQLKRTDDERR